MCAYSSIYKIFDDAKLEFVKNLDYDQGILKTQEREVKIVTCENLKKFRYAGGPPDNMDCM